MVDYDPANENSPDVPLVVLGGKPSIEQLKGAIRASAFADSYPDAFLFSATKNDLVHICRVHGIAVPGLPGADDYAVDAPTITVQPENDTVADPATGEFEVTAAGSTPLSYQWEINTGDGWLDIVGADEATYETPATVAEDDGNQYRVRVWNSAGSVYSDAATLTVT